MKKYLWLFGFFFVVAVVVTRHHEKYPTHSDAVYGNGVEFGVPAPNPPKTKGDTQNTQRDSPSWNLAYDIFGWPYGITVWALFLTLITIAEQTLQTAKAVTAAESAANTASKDLSLSARAWVGARVERFVYEVGKPLAVIIAFENSGKTPAINVRTCQVAKLITRSVEPVDISYPPECFSPGFSVIMPHEKTQRLGNAVGGNNSPRIAEDGLLTDLIAQDLRGGFRAAITFGRIDYEDIFGVKHWTTFCYAMQILPPARGMVESAGWTNAAVGNDIDRN